jgi:hypothetical protein
VTIPHATEAISFARIPAFSEHEHRAIPKRVAPGIEFGQDGSNLLVGDDFRLLPERH